MSTDDPFDQPSYRLSSNPKTTRARERRQASRAEGSGYIARIGEAWGAIQNRLGALSAAHGPGMIPSGRRPGRCALCGLPKSDHAKGGKADQGPCQGKGPVSIAPSLLTLGRAADVWPNAVLRYVGREWQVWEPQSGFVRGRGHSRREALRDACRRGAGRAG